MSNTSPTTPRGSLTTPILTQPNIKSKSQRQVTSEKAESSRTAETNEFQSPSTSSKIKDRSVQTQSTTIDHKLINKTNNEVRALLDKIEQRNLILDQPKKADKPNSKDYPGGYPQIANDILELAEYIKENDVSNLNPTIIEELYFLIDKISKDQIYRQSDKFLAVLVDLIYLTDAMKKKHLLTADFKIESLQNQVEDAILKSGNNYLKREPTKGPMDNLLRYNYTAIQYWQPRNISTDILSEIFTNKAPINQFTQDNIKFQDEIAQLNSKNNDLYTKLNTKNVELDSAYTQIEQLRNDQDQAKKQKDASNAQLQKNINELNQELITNSNFIKNQDIKFNQLNNNLTQFKNENERLRRQSADNNIENSENLTNLKESNKKLINNNQQLNKQVESQKQENDEIKKQLEENTKKYNEKITKISDEFSTVEEQLENEFNDLENDFNELKNENKQLAKELKLNQEENKNIRKHTQEIFEEKKNIKLQLNESIDRENKLISDYNELITENKNLQTQLNQQSKKLRLQKQHEGIKTQKTLKVEKPKSDQIQKFKEIQISINEKQQEIIPLLETRKTFLNEIKELGITKPNSKLGTQYSNIMGTNIEFNKKIESKDITLEELNKLIEENKITLDKLNILLTEIKSENLNFKENILIHNLKNEIASSLSTIRNVAHYHQYNEINSYNPEEEIYTPNNNDISNINALQKLIDNFKKDRFDKQNLNLVTKEFQESNKYIKNLTNSIAESIDKKQKLINQYINKNEEIPTRLEKLQKNLTKKLPKLQENLTKLNEHAEKVNNLSESLSNISIQKLINRINY